MARSTVQNGGIVTEGLVFYLDAANNKSYTGVSSSWTDLTINNTTMTMTNTPNSCSYVSTYGGGFNFPSSSILQSGLNLTPRFSIPYTTPTTGSFAVDLWFTQTLQNALYIRGILSSGEFYDSRIASSSYQPGWGIGYNGGIYTSSRAFICEYPSSNAQGITGPDFRANTPYHFFIHRNTNSQTFSFYVNGVSYGSIAYANTKTLGGFTKTINSRTWFAGGQEAPLGIFHAIKVYHNKNFTQAEILQNYNALKGRFGL
jgi:hypothetical protein